MGLLRRGSSHRSMGSKVACKQRLRTLIVEGLENRHLMASAIFEPWVTSTETADAKQAVSIGESRALAKSTHQYVVDGKSIGMIVSPTRIALDAIDSAKQNPSLLEEFGLQSIRRAGSQFQVYASQSPMDAQFLQKLVGSGLAKRAVPVFSVLDTGSEALLLDEAIVALKPNVNADDYFADHAQFSSYRPLDGTPDQFVVTLRAGYGEQALEAINSLRSDPKLVWASPNFYQSWQQFYIPNDPRFGNLWHLHNTGQAGGLVDADSDLPDAWEILPGGSANITIGVVDDGVPTNHPDLSAWVNTGEVPSNGVDDDGNGWVDDVNGWNFVSNNNLSGPQTAGDAHGTAVAGVAAARGDNNLGVVGASYKSRVLSARIFESGFATDDANIAAAIYYAAGRTKNGAGTWKAADLTNHSWGGGSESDAISAAVNWATGQGRQGKGATQLFAAGNWDQLVVYPATLAEVNPGVVVVGAVNNKGERSSYSSFGPLVDVVTGSSDSFPGTGTLTIDTTDRVGANGYSPDDYTGTGSTGFGGTSSATPLATGIAALGIARGQELGIDLTPKQLRELMRVNTDITGSDTYDATTGKSFYTGYGLLNAGSLLRGIGTQEISITTEHSEVFDGVTEFNVGDVLLEDDTEVTFHVRNQGTQDLELGSLTISPPGDFTIVQGLGSTVLGLGQSTTFKVRFAPLTIGKTIQTINLETNDTNESVFTFDVTGVGKQVTVTGIAFEDWNGDGTRQLADPGLAGRRVFLDENNNGVRDVQYVEKNFSESPSAPILDGQTTTSSMVVSQVPGPIADLDVTLNLTHTYVSDLDIVLIAPDGTRIPLAIGVGADGDNFVGTIFDDEATESIVFADAPFTGRFRPDSRLSVVDGLDANGQWKLEVSDLFLLDQGVLNNWKLTFTAETGEQVTVTNAKGRYIFDGLADGTYRATPLIPTGWIPTGIPYYEFTVTSPTDAFRGADLGSAKNNRFYAQVIDDVDADGVYDPTEKGAPGQRIVFPNPGSQTLVWANTTPMIVPDGDVATSTLSVDGMLGSVVDVNITLNIAHTFDSDLVAFLVAPDGTRVLLFANVGQDGDDFTDTTFDDDALDSIDSGTPPFTGTFRPVEALGAFNGIDPNGEWKLEIRDEFFLDEGTLLDWSIEVTSAGDVVRTTNQVGRAFIDLPFGLQTVRLDTSAPWVRTLPSNGEKTVIVAGVPLFGHEFGAKRVPDIAVDSATVSFLEGSVVQQSGTWGTPYTSDTINLTASIGSVVKNVDGTWNWTIAGADDTPTTSVTITATDPYGLTNSVSFSYEVTNAKPALTVASSKVTGNVLATLTNSGTWNDVPADTVTLTASLGSVTKNGDGTWTWSYMPSAAINNQTVTITGTDEDGGSSSVAFTLDALVAVMNRKTYYKGSSFAGTSVDAALDGTKVLAKSGPASQVLTFANLINTTRGINGVVLDVAGLASTNLTAADFGFRMSPTGAFNAAANPPSSWGNAPSPTAIVVTAGTATTPARVRIEWADNAIANRWLQIKVLANANTGLQSPEVYYLGHLLGEVNGSIEAGGFFVRSTDVGQISAQINPGVSVPVATVWDLNKDGRVRTTDSSAAIGALGLRLTQITIPPAGSGDEGEGGYGGGSLFAAPGVESPKRGGSSIVSEIKVRLTDHSFDVPLPASMVESIASARDADSIKLNTKSDTSVSNVESMSSLDEFFKQLTTRRVLIARG